MLIRFKLAGKKYELDPDDLTLGEGRLLKTDYGMGDFTELNFFDPEQLSGLAFVAVRRREPEIPDDDARALAETVKSGEVFQQINEQIREAAEKAEAEETDPPVPAANGTGGRTKKPASGSSGTTRKAAGTRSSRGSTG